MFATSTQNKNNCLKYDDTRINCTKKKKPLVCKGL